MATGVGLKKRKKKVTNHCMWLSRMRRDPTQPDRSHSLFELWRL